MKRTLFVLIGIVGLLLAPSLVHAQTLVQSTATSVPIQILGQSSNPGQFITTGTIGQITFALRKHSDTATSTVTTWAATASGGGSHDCIPPGTGGNTWSCEVTASDTDTRGIWELSWNFPGAQGGWMTREVVAAASSAANRDGSLASQSDITSILSAVNTLGTIEKNVASQSFDFWMFSTSDNLPLAGLSTAAITCSISLDGAAGATTNDTTETPVDATTHPGLYTITLTQAETNADRIAIYCAASGAFPSAATITTQH